MSAPQQTPAPTTGLPAGTRVVACTGESLVPAGTRGVVVLAAGEAAIWPAVHYEGQPEPVLTDPGWIKPAPDTSSVLTLLGHALAEQGSRAEA